MSPGTSWYGSPPDRHRDHGVAWAMAIAILFVTVAALSFAIDVSVALLPPHLPTGSALR